MKPKKKALFHILESSSVPLSLKEIRQRTGIKKAATAKLLAALDKLIQEGRLLKVGDKYIKNDGTHPSPPPAADRRNRRRPDSEVLSGVFTRHPKGFGFVAVGGGREDVFIPEEEQGTAREGDTVEVRLFPRRGRERGRITKVIKRAVKNFYGRLVRGRRTIMAMPLNEKSGLPMVLIPPEMDNPKVPNQALVEVKILETDDDVLTMKGFVVRELKVDSVEELAFEVILQENQIKEEFPPEVLQAAEAFNKRVAYDPKSGRHDLRELNFVTIDGETARDFDDAIYLEKEDNGNWRLWVSIADVAHYVQPDSLIDKEAIERGTSVYFPTHAIPMLPEALSNELCSLNPKVNRNTLTCEMLMTPEGTVVHSEIYESVIRSKARLTYSDVQKLIDGKATTIRKGELETMLHQMVELSRILIQKRYLRGSIDFSFPEYSFIFDETGEVLGIRKHYQTESMRLVEQFMLEANETVARHCEKHKLPVLYRVHDTPNVAKLEKLIKTFWFYGIRAQLDEFQEPSKFNEILKQIEGHPNKAQINILLLKCMSLASYKTTNDGHFGLAASHYTHFTSPIRRYPDLILHRALKEELRAKRAQTRPKYAVVDEALAASLSSLERRAETAERKSQTLMKIVYLEKFVGSSFMATIIAVENAGVGFDLSDLTLEAFLPLEKMLDDDYQYDPVSMTLNGRHSNRNVRGGDLMMVKLVHTDRMELKIEFELESWLDRDQV